MEFQIDKNSLQKELFTLTPIIDKKKGPLPILKYILVETAGQGLIRFTASDGDVTVRSEMEAVVKKEGSALIPGVSFFNLTRQLPEGEVAIKTETADRVRISIDTINVRLAGEAVSSFPETPQPGEMTSELPAEVFRTLIDATIFAITQEESRFTLSGAKFIVEKSHATMVSTDGHRLSYIRNNEVGSPDKVSVLIPRKALAELMKLAGMNDGGNVSFKVSENHGFFRLGSRLLITRKLTGQFPNFRSAIPATNDKEVRLNAAELSESIRRMSVLATDVHHKIVFSLDRDSLTMEANDGEVGSGTERRKVIYAGDQLKIGFNAQYLSDFLGVVGGAQITLQLKDATAQAVFAPDFGAAYTYKYVLCPVRI